MPIELQFTRDGLGVICQCQGSLGLQHFADANSRLLASPDRIKKLKYVIVDGASVEPQYFSVTQMEGIILQDRHIASYAVEGLLVALVAEQSTALGLARRWEAFVEGNRVGNEDFPVTGGSRNLDTHPRESQVQAGYFAVHGEGIISAARSPCSLDRFSAYSVRWRPARICRADFHPEQLSRA